MLPLGGATSAEAAAAVAELDFLSVHVYPKSADDGVETVKRFATHKPLVVEETFPLNCRAEELGRFIDQSRPWASGWVGFYWGQTPDELRGSQERADALMVAWLHLFRARAKHVP